MTAPIWTLEAALWTGGLPEYRKSMDPSCMMVLPGPGILQGEAILASLEAAPRWREVDMAGRHLAETDGLCVLGYVATANREGAAPYRAACSSAWVRRESGWKIVQHQQTPLD
ncbi:DUF4440 domain-containing protein [Frigidibacter albus]|uniref:DUF4440 domain-containing protein n=1 Tax=Frigidibacter albus TaxID=1465486 RepID=A0A6L8VEY5_9RHOB|nr:nuclear transport factor 2 family protein [Frigidibacter albus]MZQ88907.1 DUF4440 domain-containing protein [Frigidibacter albus]NBE31036.1 DUF4440 domain-containing protein [Frigidibacter albus]GGH52498.1 hypothetical protein GCM10011341_17070 [Frigidibacter albus]